MKAEGGKSNAGRKFRGKEFVLINSSEIYESPVIISRSLFLMYLILLNIVRAVLVLGLLGAGWSVYRRMPQAADALDGETVSANILPETMLHVVLRRAPNDRASGANVEVELYPVDLAEAQRAFEQIEKRPGLNFNNFLKHYMNGKKTLKTHTDARGQAVLNVPPGEWWIHVTLNGTRRISWRVPVQINEREQTIELTPENAYAKEKTF